MSKRRLVKLRPSKMKIDLRYQREPDDARVRAMADSINEQLLGVPVVSTRDNGDVYAIDGGHRITALCLAGLGDKSIMVEEYTGLTVAQEAQMFWDLQDKRRGMAAFNSFKARVTAQDPEALEIVRIVKSAGLRVSPTPAFKTICAVKSLEHVHRKHKNLAKVLSVLVNWADGDPRTFEGKIIKDVATFVSYYADNVDILALSRSLSPIAPESLSRKIKAFRGIEEIPRDLVVLKVIRDIYNKTNKGKRRLPPPTESSLSGKRKTASS